MSLQDPESWPLASLKEIGLDAARIHRIRQRGLPDTNKLRAWQQSAHQHGIEDIDLWDLAIEREGLSDHFALEFGETSTPVGQVSKLRVRGSVYCFMWLINGTTYEVIEDKGSSFRFFADGSLIGDSTVVESTRFLGLFSFAVRWSIRVGNECVFECSDTGPRRHMHITKPGDLPWPVWVGSPTQKKVPHAWKYPLWKAAGWAHRLPNDLWFLPRIGKTFREDSSRSVRLGLLAFAMANRRARSD